MLLLDYVNPLSKKKKMNGAAINLTKLLCVTSNKQKLTKNYSKCFVQTNKVFCAHCKPDSKEKQCRSTPLAW